MSAKSERVKRVVPRFLRPPDASFILGGEQVLRDCESAKWIAPAHRHKSLTLFRFADVHACADRIDAGEWPEKI